MEVNLFTFTLRGSPCTSKKKKTLKLHFNAIQQKTMKMLGIPILSYKERRFSAILKWKHTFNALDNLIISNFVSSSLVPKTSFPVQKIKQIRLIFITNGLPNPIKFRNLKPFGHKKKFNHRQTLLEEKSITQSKGKKKKKTKFPNSQPSQ